MRFIPKFDFVKVDMHNYTDDKIKETFETLSLQAMLLAMKHIYDSIPDLIKSIGKIYKDIDKIFAKPNGQEIINQLTHYLLFATQIKPKDMEKQIKQISESGAKKFISGWEQSIIDEKKEIAINMINLGLTDEQIVISTNLNIQLVLKLRKFAERTKKEYKTI